MAGYIKHWTELLPEVGAKMKKDGRRAVELEMQTKALLDEAKYINANLLREARSQWSEDDLKLAFGSAALQ